MRRITMLIAAAAIFAMLWWPVEFAGQPMRAAPGAAPSATATPAPAPLAAAYLREVADLGRDLGLGWAQGTRSSFVVLSPRGSGWSAKTLPVLENVYERFCQSFLNAGFTLDAPSGPLTWVCFATRADFDRYARSADRSDLWWSRGYYSTRTNRVAVFRPRDAHHDEDMTEVAHEAAHQLAYNTGLQKRGVMYPVWVSEGIATNLETALNSPWPLAATNPRRLRALRGAGLIPLSQLTAWTSVPVENEQATENAYAQIWGVFHFLLNRKPVQLKDYMASLSRLPAGRRNELQLRQEFLRSFGPFESLDAQFRQYVATLAIETTVASGQDAPAN
ncbi:MAG: DUF1570 domain-containing protein [Planctomycetaceae bacterium]|nr:DUF1570 domain-containing protein [Planctomycetaceae bacterium]